MKKDSFIELTKDYNIVPVYEKVTADMLTPVLAYLKIREKNKVSFLLESVEGIGRFARYSFIAKNPFKLIKNRGKRLTVVENGKAESMEKNIFDYLQEEIKRYRYAKVEGLPDFTGGIVGYLGFETISQIEDTIKFSDKEKIDIPDSILGLFSTIIVFDHYTHQIILIHNAFIQPGDPVGAIYDSALSELKELKTQLLRSSQLPEPFSLFNGVDSGNGKRFEELVKKAKDNITNGDVFQIVLSERFSSEYSGDTINVYRALRIINPSPYMYYMQFEDDFTIAGTSPEDLLKVKERKAEILPIAGTRRRGKTAEEDQRLEMNLLADPKEIAEHTMLVDLARNDLGGVCKYGTVKVTEKMKVQRFSHVMHIVSRVEGRLAGDKDCIDALKHAFPAGTVTGAPKIRAIQLINEYEEVSRNVYAGAIGYIDFGGNLDMCIAIRTIFAKEGKVYWQAGAGIVSDSIPRLEWKEIENKSSVLVNALKYAEVIDETSDYR